MKEAQLRRHAMAIFRAALNAADPAEAVRRHLRLSGGALIAGRARYPLKHFDNVFVVGAGKAGAAMAYAVEQILDRRIRSGLINVKYGHVRKLRHIELNECGHPVPDSNGERGARRIAEIAAAAGERDLVICLISGGASALLPLPAEPVTLAEKQRATQLLLDSGANIHEINAVRKHISRIKGGQLSRIASPATVIGLMLSDVIGDDLDVIGSGPTAADASTYKSARSVLEKYGIWNRAAPSVRERIEAGERGLLLETPKLIERTQNVIVGSNRQALEAAVARAKTLGFRTMLLSSFVEGETRDIARMHAAIAKEIRHSGKPLAPPACIVTGGETTVTMSGHGKGGRNQEFVLAAAIDIAGLQNVVVLSAGTDGSDGPTDAAGAIADGRTVARAEKLGMSPQTALADHDAYPFFEKLNDLVITGPTNTNVMDVHLVLVGAMVGNSK
ncbi:MAG: glycerate kinase [Acidobacteriota bacterium]|nr:glycerate kinase [Acidobacteriota bacterium]